MKPRLLQNAEYWPGEVGNYPKSMAVDRDALLPMAARDSMWCSMMDCAVAVRGAVQAASYGQSAAINFDAIAGEPLPAGICSWLAGRALR